LLLQLGNVSRIPRKELVETKTNRLDAVADGCWSCNQSNHSDFACSYCIVRTVLVQIATKLLPEYHPHETHERKRKTHEPSKMFWLGRFPEWFGVLTRSSHLKSWGELNNIRTVASMAAFAVSIAAVMGIEIF
jgi:hypothetical protein